MSSRELEDYQERKQHEWVASQLGITHEELDQLDWELSENGGNDGAVYGHYVTIQDGADPDILAKISGLQDGRWVAIGFPSDDEEPDNEG